MNFLKGQNPQGGPSRRTLIAGVTAAGAAVAAGLYRFTDLFVKHYPPTPYDDLLKQLVDREQAAKLGEALVIDLPHEGYPKLSAENIAKELRHRLADHNLREVIDADIVAGRMVETEGWVLPLSVALLSTLAFRVERPL
jgi:hypothetical protein